MVVWGDGGWKMILCLCYSILLLVREYLNENQNRNSACTSFGRLVCLINRKGFDVYFYPLVNNFQIFMRKKIKPDEIPS